MPDRSTKIKASILDAILEVQNPATEEKQDSIITAIQGMGGLGTTLRGGRKTVAIAGTAETLVASSTPLLVGVVIKAFKENSGIVYVGTSSVDSNSDKQYELEAGEAIAISVNDLVKIYVDVSVSGESVQFIGS